MPPPSRRDRAALPNRSLGRPQAPYDRARPRLRTKSASKPENRSTLIGTSSGMLAFSIATRSSVENRQRSGGRSYTATTHSSNSLAARMAVCRWVETSRVHPDHRTQRLPSITCSVRRTRPRIRPGTTLSMAREGHERAPGMVGVKREWAVRLRAALSHAIAAPGTPSAITPSRTREEALHARQGQLSEGGVDLLGRGRSLAS